LRTLVLAALAAFLLAPASARAATARVIGQGADPGLAVDAAGTAYLAWNGTEPSGTRSLHFCRLPRGAAGCAGAATLAVPDGTYSLYRPFVSVSGPLVQVTQSRYGFAAGSFDQVIQFTSQDGGNTFDAGTPVGTITFNEAVNGPGGVAAVTFSTTGGGFFQRMAAGNAASALLSPDHLYDGAVGVTPAGQLVTVLDDASGNAQLRVQSGAGDPNDAGTWGAPVELGVESYPRLAGGPAGLFLMGENASRGLEVRRWNGTTFGAPAVIGTGNEAAQAALTQDAGGRLHAVWPAFAAGGIELHYAVSDNGSSWSAGVVDTQQASDGEQDELRVAAAPDHVGVAVWTSASQVRLLAVGPAPPPEFHKTVTVRPVSGKVLVKLPGAKRFVALSAAGSVPLGASVDATRGRLALSSAPSKTGRPQTVQLYSGRFKVTQPGKVTQFTLNGPLAACGKASAAKRKPRSRKLWGDGKGAFRTTGRYSAATVRGTRWLVQDSCAGTLTRVVRGVVSVRDDVRHKTVVLRAGKRDLARARR
jgi:hypothetical protein